MTSLKDILARLPATKSIKLTKSDVKAIAERVGQLAGENMKPNTPNFPRKIDITVEFFPLPITSMSLNILWRAVANDYPSAGTAWETLSITQMSLLGGKTPEDCLEEAARNRYDAAGRAGLGAVVGEIKLQEMRMVPK